MTKRNNFKSDWVTTNFVLSAAGRYYYVKPFSAYTRYYESMHWVAEIIGARFTHYGPKDSSNS